MERVAERWELLSEAASATPSPRRLPATPDLPTFEFVRVPPDRDAGASDHAAREEALAFRLFAPPPGATRPAPVAKIRLASPEAETAAEPGFVRPRRNPAYYFARAATGREAANFHAAARSGQQVRQGARSVWPGMAYPWRLLTLPSTRQQRRLLSPSSPHALASRLLADAAPLKRRRPGKKARIARRLKAAAATAQQNAAQQAAAAKAAADQAKRTRRNREKKVKKKTRDKAKKAEAAGSGSGSGSGCGSGCGSGSASASASASAPPPC